MIWIVQVYGHFQLDPGPTSPEREGISNILSFLKVHSFLSIQCKTYNMESNRWTVNLVVDGYNE